MKDLIKSAGQLLIEKKLTIAFAESATAGELCWSFSKIEDAGKFLKGGIVCYDACLKQSLLGVEADLINRYTPESMEVTKAITMGLSALIPAAIHVGITGLTAPGGSETPEKPVGTMFLFASHNGKHLFSGRYNFTGSRIEITEGILKAFATELIKALGETKI